MRPHILLLVVLATCWHSLNGQLALDDSTETVLSDVSQQSSREGTNKGGRSKFYKPSRSPAQYAERSRYKHHRPSRHFESSAGTTGKGKTNWVAMLKLREPYDSTLRPRYKVKYMPMRLLDSPSPHYNGDGPQTAMTEAIVRPSWVDHDRTRDFTVKNEKPRDVNKEVFTTTFPPSAIVSEESRLEPSEILLPPRKEAYSEYAAYNVKLTSRPGKKRVRPSSSQLTSASNNNIVSVRPSYRRPSKQVKYITLVTKPPMLPEHLPALLFEGGLLHPINPMKSPVRFIPDHKPQRRPAHMQHFAENSPPHVFSSNIGNNAQAHIFSNTIGNNANNDWIPIQNNRPIIKHYHVESTAHPPQLGASHQQQVEHHQQQNGHQQPIQNGHQHQIQNNNHQHQIQNNNHQQQNQNNHQQHVQNSQQHSNEVQKHQQTEVAVQQQEPQHSNPQESRPESDSALRAKQAELRAHYNSVLQQMKLVGIEVTPSIVHEIKPTVHPTVQVQKHTQASTNNVESSYIQTTAQPLHTYAPPSNHAHHFNQGVMNAKNSITPTSSVYFASSVKGAGTPLVGNYAYKLNHDGGSSRSTRNPIQDFNAEYFVQSSTSPTRRSSVITSHSWRNEKYLRPTKQANVHSTRHYPYVYEGRDNSEADDDIFSKRMQNPAMLKPEPRPSNVRPIYAARPNTLKTTTSSYVKQTSQAFFGPDPHESTGPRIYSRPGKVQSLSMVSGLPINRPIPNKYRPNSEESSEITVIPLYRPGKIEALDFTGFFKPISSTQTSQTMPRPSITRPSIPRPPSIQSSESVTRATKFRPGSAEFRPYSAEFSMAMTKPPKNNRPELTTTTSRPIKSPQIDDENSGTSQHVQYNFQSHNIPTQKPATLASNTRYVVTAVTTKVLRHQNNKVNHKDIKKKPTIKPSESSSEEDPIIIYPVNSTTDPFKYSHVTPTTLSGARINKKPVEHSHKKDSNTHGQKKERLMEMEIVRSHEVEISPEITHYYAPVRSDANFVK